MEEEEGNGEGTPPLKPRRYELLVAAIGEDNTPAAAVSTHMNFEGRREFFFQPPPTPSDGGARSSAGECAAAAAIKLLTPQSIMGLSLVSTPGTTTQSAVNKVTEGTEEGEMRSYSQKTDTVTMHSDLIQVIFII